MAKQKHGQTLSFPCFYICLLHIFGDYPHLAGAERIELPSKVLETPMLPLYHAPKSQAKIIIS